jgi:PhnB protein
MMSDAKKETWKAMSYFYVTDHDVLYRRVLEVGATSLIEPKDQFYGDRDGGVKDPVGNH